MSALLFFHLGETRHRAGLSFTQGIQQLGRLLAKGLVSWFVPRVAGGNERVVECGT